MWCMLNSLHFHAWHSVCAVCEIALIRRELFVPISFCWRFEVYPTQTSVFFFFEKQFCKITNVMNFMEMWCNLHNCISMHDILCVHYLWIDLFSRTCMCITSTKLPISFPKKKNCVSVNAIEFLHRWCYGFSNEILTHVRHGNEYLICYAAWAFSGNM